MLLRLADKSRTVTAIVTLANIAAFVFLGAVAAYWTWNWLAPQPSTRALPAVETEAKLGPAGLMFGGVAGAGNRSSGASNTIRLLGIIADAKTHQGYAVVQLEPREVLVVREGEEITPGIRLTKVGPDHIVLERAGLEETLAFPEKKGAAEKMAPRQGK